MADFSAVRDVSGRLRPTGTLSLVPGSVQSGLRATRTLPVVGRSGV